MARQRPLLLRIGNSMNAPIQKCQCCRMLIDRVGMEPQRGVIIIRCSINCEMYVLMTWLPHDCLNMTYVVSCSDFSGLSLHQRMEPIIIFDVLHSDITLTIGKPMENPGSLFMDCLRADGSNDIA